MKMKLWKRVSITLFALMTLALLGLYALEVFDCGYATCIRELITDAEGAYVGAWLAIALAAFAFVAVLCFLMILMAARDGRIKAARMIVLKDEGGDHVLLSQQTLDELVMRSMGAPEGVSDVKITTAYADARLEILIDVAVASDINIPATTRQIQEDVRRQIAVTSGINVSDVSIRISTIKIPEGEDISMRGRRRADAVEAMPGQAPEAPAPYEPEPIEPEPAASEPEPEVSEPESIEPEAAEPEAVEHEIAEPEAAEPEPEACEPEPEACEPEEAVVSEPGFDEFAQPEQPEADGYAHAAPPPAIEGEDEEEDAEYGAKPDDA